jgi:hypothetical protein
VDPSCQVSPELIDFLVSLGATPEQIAQADPSSLGGLGADLVFAAAEGFTAGEVATRAGVDVDTVFGIWRALGVEVPDGDTAMFSTADISFVETLSSVDLFTDNEGDELLHVVGSALSRVAMPSSASTSAPSSPAWPRVAPTR